MKKGLSYLWIYLYILIISLLIVSFTSLLLPLNFLFTIVLLLLSIIPGIIAWKLNFSNTALILHSITNFFAPVLLAILISYPLSNPVILVSFLIPVATIDLISFTRLGRNTINSRIGSNTMLAKRLSICLPLPGDKTMYQITGLGDTFIFALITATSIKILNPKGFTIAIISVVFGQIFNILGILYLKNRPNFRGFPAATAPIVLYILLMIASLAS